MVTKVFVDTYYLVAVVSDESRKRADAKRVLSKLRAHVFDVVIPQAALGEAASVIMRDYADPNDVHNKLCKLYDDLATLINFRKCLPPPTMKAFECVGELRQNDQRLRETDMLIAGQALADPDSQRLLTRDTDLRNSQAIIDVEKKMREEGDRSEMLRVTDRI